MTVFQDILKEMKNAKGIYRKAATLFRRTITGRIFKDGNHRTAQALTEIFLEMNEASMKIQDSKEITGFIKNILHYDIDEIEAWLKHGTTKGSNESIQRSTQETRSSFSRTKQRIQKTEKIAIIVV